MDNASSSRCQGNVVEDGADNQSHVSPGKGASTDWSLCSMMTSAIVTPGFNSRAKGRDTCLKSYKDACSQMKIEKLDASDEHIEVFGSTAVVSYKYDCIFEFSGQEA